MLEIIKKSDLETERETLVIPVSEDIEEFAGKEFSKISKKARNLEEFKGENDKLIVFYSPEDTNAKRAILCGTGKKEELTYEIIRRYAANAIKKGISLKADEIDFIFPDVSKTKLDIHESFKALVEGALLANYSFNELKSKKDDSSIKKIRIAVEDSKFENLKKLASKTEIICKHVFFARDIVSTPSNLKRPSVLKNIISSHAEKSGVKATIFTKEELEQKGFNAHLAVSRGSSEPAFLVILEYTPKAYDKTIAIVGKGITFDAGGLDLKPASGMETMKLDMGGAAAVSATISALAELHTETKIVALIPIAENMPGGDAYRPGDIVTTYSGKTVEVLNTDAEGRLILADSISYAEKLYNPDLIINVATLTGACMVALGEDIAGVFSTDNKMAHELMAIGEKINEPCWVLPMHKDYAKSLKSKIADLKNISGGRYGGAITAALFLKEFVKKTEFIHIDIAGPAFRQKDEYYLNAGGTGYGVRLLTEFISSLV